jgi:hypothetical protein
MRRIRKPGDNFAFGDPPAWFNAKREKNILDKDAAMK